MTVRDYHKQIENGIEYIVATERLLTEFYLNGKLHREIGPAYTYGYPGSIVIEKWYIEGKEIPFKFYSRAEYDRKIKLSAFW